MGQPVPQRRAPAVGRRQSDPTRRILDASGADPDDLARQIEAAVPRGRPCEDTPPLAPAAKRALLDAHRESRRSGATYIGPEHILLGIAANPETTAARALRALAGPRGLKVRGRDGVAFPLGCRGPTLIRRCRCR
ncbi:Clp protease N-terminal domain-containing protein [Micromonospora sp. NPDC005707]|uniref:Clp protease N-terminal domain-containing protein n=1 Tax=Micromonospora sp. NPDC005707 TaxID=3157050 RepID=UPI0033DD6031